MGEPRVTTETEGPPPRPIKERGVVGIALLLMIGLALRIVWVGLVPNEQVADFAVYDGMASSFVRGLGYVDGQGRPSAFKPIGFPLFLALVYRVFGESPFAAKVVQANLSVLLAFLIFLLALRLWDDTRAFVALTLAILHPTFIYFTSLLGTETLFACLTMGALLLLLHRPGDDSPPRLRYAALAGLLIGMAALVRPMALLVPMAVIFWLALSQKRFLPAFKVFVVFCLTLMLPILPWTIRNYARLGSFVPISTNGGYNLYYGNNPQDTLVWIPIEQLRTVPGFPEAQWARMTEPARSKAMRRLAIEHIKSDPAGFFLRMAPKFYLLLLSPDVPGLYWNIEGLDEDHTPSRPSLTLLASLNRVFSYGMLLLALAGLFVDGLDDRRFALIHGILFVWIAMHLLYWGKPRFRFPLIPLFIVFAAGPLARISAALRRRFGFSRTAIARSHR